MHLLARDHETIPGRGLSSSSETALACCHPEARGHPYSAPQDRRQDRPAHYLTWTPELYRSDFPGGQDDDGIVAEVGQGFQRDLAKMQGPLNVLFPQERPRPRNRRPVQIGNYKRSST